MRGVRPIPVLFVLCFATGVFADDPPKLKTQTIRLKLAQPLKDDNGKDSDISPSIELVQLPPGTITLKNEDGKEVTHTIKPIWIAKYETRWDEYEVFWFALDLPEAQRARQRSDRAKRVGPPFMPPWGDNERHGHPACSIHLQAAKKYCVWLSNQTGKKYRLPTEAEWEFACRAGGPPVRPDTTALDKVAWFKGNSGRKTHLVGQKQPNAWGLYDMLGNVAEYVIRDPKDEKGLVAGGAWSSDAKNVHSGARAAYEREWQRNDPNEPPSTDWYEYDRHDLGFRVVMEE
jgi:formylglycine-generating enzyme required for sulfatase activity